MHFVNGYGLLIVGTNQGNIYVFKTILSSNDIEIEQIDMIKINKSILNFYTNLRLDSKSRHKVCEYCKLIVYC